MRIREKLIIENELKYLLNNKSDFIEIMEFLELNYDVIPYKTAELYDVYYDTLDFRLKKLGISYRIRKRPQISINMKLPGDIKDGIWSRYEYSCKIDKKNLTEKELLSIDCKIHDILKKSLNIDCMDLCALKKINTRRYGFLINKKNKNVLNKLELIGVAFFDVSKNDCNKLEIFEFEMETYEQTDVFVSPSIFDELIYIGKYIESRGFLKSKKSKYERAFEEYEF
ncbi:CYTH domain-containing protein [Parvimonas parva]|uniref:CYTH domain-containing protein n=1 Tax=Parvimonas parva TaxID=2769485 RepID=A0ABS1C8G4_9FIRM|nr:CYTH domain-containing protein [Parvimonas parva]MBK1468382.1 CYTH domain-containing protein [Parvimonas parva]